MGAAPNRPPALRFLDEIELDRKIAYSTASWLESNFHENIWIGHVGRAPISIDFNILLYDGSHLTSTQNTPLLQLFKHWLCVQTHSDLIGGKVLGEKSLKRRIDDTLSLIDYFLLNGEQYQLAKYGLKLVTENDIAVLLDKISRSSKLCNSLYDWKFRFENFLSTNSANMHISYIESAIKKTPLLDNPLCADNQRAANNRAGRVWLWENGFYSAIRRKVGGCSLNTTRVCAILYRNTLRGRNMRPSEPDFTLCNDDVYHRELKQVHVKNYDSIESSKGRANDLKNIIFSLELVESVSSYTPPNLPEYSTRLSKLDYPEKGRYKTLPMTVMFSCLKNALEFYIEYADLIFDTVIKASKTSKELGISVDDSFENEIVIPEKLRALGVCRWNITPRTGYSPEYSSSKQYFSGLRSNISLLLLYKVLMGAIAIAIGLLSARRQSELLNLGANSALDRTCTRLIYRLMKSGTLDLRARTAIPIPKICTTMIKSIEKFQKQLCGKNFNLFSKMNDDASGFCAATPSIHNHLFDIFCDYFQTAEESPGRRYYIRQHQLRRGFAMAFFWSGAPGGMEILRRFLGHTDASHLYNYITESTDGAVFRSIKANFVAGNIANLDDEKNNLSLLLSEKFGTSEITILDSLEVERYIETLLLNRTMSVEPIFIECENGTTYEVVVRIKR